MSVHGTLYLSQSEPSEGGNGSFPANAPYQLCGVQNRVNISRHADGTSENTCSCGCQNNLQYVEYTTLIAWLYRKMPSMGRAKPHIMRCAGGIALRCLYRLTQQGQHVLRNLVGLRQYGHTCLLQDICTAHG